MRLVEMEEATAASDKRPYRSILRTKQAAATRARLLRAARHAFSERGYPGATMEGIAAEAGVSVQAVYWIFGNKQKLLRAVLEGVGEQARLGPQIGAILAAQDPCLQMSLIAALSRGLWSAGAVLLRGIERARGTDPTFDAWLRTLDDERLQGQRPVVEQLRERHQLRPGVGVDEGSDLLFVLSGPTLYLQLVDERSWAETAYEAWLARTLCQTLLRDDLPCQAHRVTEASADF